MKYLILTVLLLPLTLLSQTSFERGENYFNSEKYDQAKLQFEKALIQNPNDLKTIEYLGDIQCHLKHWERAIPYYEKLTKRNPLAADYFYKYGGAMGMLAKESNKIKALLLLDDVKAAFEKAIQLNPNHIGARWALLEIYIQLPGIVGGSERKAVKYSDELLKISPVDGYLSKGYIEEYFNRYVKAEKQYKKAIEVGQSATTYQKLADLYKNKMDQPEKAKQILAAYNEKNKS
jgi:tetratricopeptide (TPR) repeat protein